ncbi:hypothetical protein KKB55_13000 [Myxococcota bacterium]|nr:hypothetical protein [Myxococcota bacterium]MBU1898659.1 hypothetical protein [Myxococcota bacterium]
MKTLICTVGGSYEPIIKSIKHHNPDHIVFVCSEDDPYTGRSGSYIEITQEGNVCTSSAARESRKADQPNIPAQLGLDVARYEVLKVPADEPAIAIQAIQARIEASQAPGAQLIADYTGGTKSMSCSLFVAASQREGVALSLVKGPRVDLVRISSGLESVEHVDVNPIKSDWQLQEARRAWRYHAYRQAEDILARASGDKTRRPLFFSRGYALWDEFEHEAAKGILHVFAAQLPEGTIRNLAWLLEDSQRGEALKIWDLFLMSDRRAASKRYDTAVLLLYRVVEWIAQWTLRWHHDIDCSNVVGAQAEALMDLTAEARNGNRVLGLYAAWSAIERLDGPLKPIAEAHVKRLQTFAERRNQSMFAHGKAPLNEADWRASRAFAESIIQALITHQFKGTAPYPQLPTEMPL